MKRIMTKLHTAINATRKRRSLQWRLMSLLLALIIAGCGPTGRRALSLDTSQQLIDFLRDGTTMRQEVIDRYGEPLEEYEDGRIWIYRPFEKYTGKIQGLRQRVSARKTNDTPSSLDISREYRHGVLVLVFREDDVLESHSIVIAK